jgi:type IV pilus assembly protein PilW
LTLVEMLVALVLAMIIVASLGQLYLGGREAYRLTEVMSQMNEDGRFGLDFLAQELRMAGYFSCGGPNALVATTVNSGSQWTLQSGGIDGYEGGVDTFPTFGSSVKPGTDAVIVRRADVSTQSDVWVHSTSTNRIFFRSDPGLHSGDVAVIHDGSCTQATIFQVTYNDASVGGTYFSVYHSDSATLVPGNCSDWLGGAFDCADTSNAFDLVYGEGGYVTPYIARAFYVANDAESTLYMSELVTDAHGDASFQDYPLLRNVDTLQLLYGVSASGSGSQVDSYVTADQITNWSSVLSVRIALLVRSGEDNLLTEPGASAITVAGTSIGVGTDKRVRKLFNTAVGLRNNLP